MATADLHPLLEALDEPAMVVEDRIILLANQAARTLLGQAIEGSDVRLTLRHPQVLEHLLSAAPGDLDVAGIGQVGRPWTLSIRRLDGQSMLVRLIDRSAVVAAEKMRVDFVANASHELRTPLSTILGYAETLAGDDQLDAARRMKFGQVIHGEAESMLRIIEDLMSLSRIQAGRFVSPTEVIALRDIIDQSVTRARQFLGAMQCKLETDVEDNLPRLIGDPGQISQLLDNLLANAVRYGCEASECMVRVTARAEKQWIRLSVSDNGPGIAEQHLPLLTARFYRVDPARSRDSGGTGLGLAIVKHIVERHRGTLEIRSQLGEGTEVIVCLPHES